MAKSGGSFWYTFSVASFASIGFILYGFDTGIATTTIAHKSFLEYMNQPSNALIGAVVSAYIAGETVGSILQIAISDPLGRIKFMQLMCIIVTLGVSLQTGARNIGMLIAGRAIAGIGVGGLSGTVPVYLSEIAPPQNRGLIGGLSGVGLAFGQFLANWIGFACQYAPYGATQWRLPLAIQIPWGVILFAGLATFMPNSPRQLIQKGKVEEARIAFTRIRADLHSHAVQEEFGIMRGQIEYEMERKLPSWKEMWKLYQHRVLVAVSVQILTSVTGVNVIQYYQTRLYADLGINYETRLALTGVWGSLILIANAISIKFLPDRLGRRRMLLIGVACVVVVEIYSAVMQREFQHTDNRVGKGFGILGIYVFGVLYYIFINSVTWLYGAEVLPVSIRSRMMGVSAAAHYIVNVGLTQAGPSAFANTGENYYYVFVGCCTVYWFIIYFFYPETKQKTLEEIARAFGDNIVEVPADRIEAEGAVLEEKAGSAVLIDDHRSKVSA